MLSWSKTNNYAIMIPVKQQTFVVAGKPVVDEVQGSEWLGIPRTVVIAVPIELTWVTKVFGCCWATEAHVVTLPSALEFPNKFVKFPIATNSTYSESMFGLCNRESSTSHLHFFSKSSAQSQLHNRNRDDRTTNKILSQHGTLSTTDLHLHTALWTIGGRHSWIEMGPNVVHQILHNSGWEQNRVLFQTVHM